VSSGRSLARDLYGLRARRPGADVQCEEVGNEILDTTEHLDSDRVLHQAETVVRLAVVTMLGLIVNVVTGGFGMNQLAEADDPPPVRGRLRSLLALWSRRREAAAHELVMSEQSRTRCAAGPRRRHATRGRVAVCPSQ
jgi:hypothetical protein